MDETQLAVGDLSNETFEAIPASAYVYFVLSRESIKPTAGGQERALKLLCQYIDNDQQEMLYHFDIEISCIL